ncbi:vomeronasal type-1 receptor 4-like isoform X1 [Acomys russatus]|uniref:vomeronasal type-1 receptor 4-like isoform X1 n=1 Tax=Acomys russatus TaxID=60746 RepID=UPI0021E2AE5D|nr:vomeronasal type-1 receptor 4-like isoform X1 [Acomys russatus]
MQTRNTAIGILLSLQSALGILGNFSLIFYYLLLYCTEHTMKIVDVILMHVFTTNSLIILSKGLPEIMESFGLIPFFSDVACKFFLYFYRLGKSMSISLTALLSVFQAITISPRNLCCMEFKVKTTAKFMSLLICLCWILHVVVNMIFPVYTSTKRNRHTNKTQMRDFEFCHSQGRDKIVDSLYTAFCVFPEVLFSLLIVCSSTFMIVTLYGHKKRVHQILSTCASQRISPENRATQTILILVCTFVAFHTISSILNGYTALYHDSSGWVMNISSIIYMCFPTLSPFVMSHDFTVSRFCFTRIRNRKIT